MTTLKLLWGMTWRGAAWGALCGTVLGAASQILGTYIERFWNFAIGDRLYFTLDLFSDDRTAIILIAGLFGFQGLFASLIGGLSLGSLARLFFFARKNGQEYARRMKVLGAVWGVIAALLSTSILGMSLIDPIVWIITVVFAVTTMFSMYQAIRWYENEMKGVTAANA